MLSDCPWLPPMVAVSPWRHGGASDTYEILYGIFRRDLVEHQPHYRGTKVWHFPDKKDGKEELFWHLTSREIKPKPIPRRKMKFAASIRQQTQRYPDLRRSERLPWVRAMIENVQQAEILSWDYREGSGKIKTYVWLKDYDFVVIMKKYGNGNRRLITSFHLDKPYTKRDFERKYKNRLA